MVKKKVAIGLGNFMNNSLQNKYPLLNKIMNPSVLIWAHNTNSIESMVISFLSLKLGVKIGVISIIILFL